MSVEVTINDKVYLAVPEQVPGGCAGCAFGAAPGCSDASDQHGCAANRVIFVAKPVELDPTSLLSEVDLEPEVRAVSDSKPTNPKDAIGIRKAPLSCVPMNVVAEIGIGMLEGAAKYGRHNFRAVGVRDSVYFDGTLRHILAYWEGEDIDPDTVELDESGNPIPGTGVHHLTKALTSLTVWRDAQLQGMSTDDRPPRSKPFYPELNRKAAAILDRHAGKNPRHYTIEDSQ